jgi:hypothetical protein
MKLLFTLIFYMNSSDWRVTSVHREKNQYEIVVQKAVPDGIWYRVCKVSAFKYPSEL